VHFILLTVVVVCFLPQKAIGEARFFGIQVDRAMRLSGLSVPLVAGGEGGVGRIIFDKVSVQSKKIGGLRIGILPELVIEGMRLEVPPSEQPDRWALGLHGMLNREPLLQSAIISGIVISERHGREFLRAERGAVARDGSSIQLNGVTMFPDEKKIPAAELALSGPKAGSLLIEKNPRPVQLIFSSNS
jgi:hypothetical protein